jgi:hypothetical protein
VAGVLTWINLAKVPRRCSQNAGPVAAYDERGQRGKTVHEFNRPISESPDEKIAASSNGRISHKPEYFTLSPSDENINTTHLIASNLLFFYWQPHGTHPTWREDHEAKYKFLIRGLKVSGGENCCAGLLCANIAYPGPREGSDSMDHLCSTVGVEDHAIEEESDEELQTL